MRKGRERLLCFRQQDLGNEQKRMQESKTVGPPLTDRAVCLARTAGLDKPLGVMRFNATPEWAANGNEMVSEAVHHPAQRGDS